MRSNAPTASEQAYDEPLYDKATTAVNKLDQEQTNALEAKIVKTYYDAYKPGPDVSVPDAAEAATVHVCKQFGLLYYRGDRSGLRRET